MLRSSGGLTWCPRHRARLPAEPAGAGADRPVLILSGGRPVPQSVLIPIRTAKLRKSNLPAVVATKVFATPIADHAFKTSITNATLKIKGSDHVLCAM
ncbi:hypothetical protein M8494_16655 [Serratia ureilytica]